MIKKRILVVAAHPDDEVLGCGGTITKLSKIHDIYTLILGEGITSRDHQQSKKNNTIQQLKKDAEKANKILGIRKVFFKNLPDNKFDTVPLLNIIKEIEYFITKIKPEIVYTHHHDDLNIDHQLTHRAVLTATRPLSECSVKRIFSFEVLSSTEWNKFNESTIFIPNMYVDISSTIENKLAAMQCYKTELRNYPHPRSLEGIKILAQRRGLEIGLEFAEAFHLIRMIE